jgi:hypothetical protein
MHPMKGFLRPGASLLGAVLIAALFAAAPARAQAPSLSDVPINASTNLYCPGPDGEPQFQTYANLGNVMRRMAERFHFDMSVQAGTPLTLMFSAPADSPFFISYVIEPYRDVTGRTGIVLRKMHIFLDNADRDLAGTPMCYFTVFGK